MVNRDFVPIALKAQTVARPHSSLLGKYYAEIKRSMPAPQGIGIANSSGKLLAWALTFESPEAIPQFFEHVKNLHSASPDAEKPITTEIYRRFPTHPGEKVADTRSALPSISTIKKEATQQKEPPSDAIECRIVGRRLNNAGAPVQETRIQEHYVEDRLTIPGDVQAELATAARTVEVGKPFPLTKRLTSRLVAVAFLGKLDVAPLASGTVEKDVRNLWGRVAKRDGEKTVIEFAGTSQTHGKEGEKNLLDGRKWHNRIALVWTGTLTLENDRIEDLAIYATGTESLFWHGYGGDDQAEAVKHLLSGRKIDSNGKVAFGILPAK